MGDDRDVCLDPKDLSQAVKRCWIAVKKVDVTDMQGRKRTCDQRQQQSRYMHFKRYSNEGHSDELKNAMLFNSGVRDVGVALAATISPRVKPSKVMMM